MALLSSDSLPRSGGATTLVALLFSGTIVDRLPRRTVILTSDLASGFVVSVLALLGFAGALRIEHLYVGSAIFGVSFAFFGPAMTAIIPELVPPDILQAGNAVRGLSRQLGRLGGPVLGGVIVAVAGPPIAFAIDAVSFFLSFALLSFARPPRRELRYARRSSSRSVPVSHSPSPYRGCGRRSFCSRSSTSRSSGH